MTDIAEHADPAAMGRPRRKGPWTALAALTALVIAVPLMLEFTGTALQRTAKAVVPIDRPVSEVRVDVGAAGLRVGEGGRPRLRQRLSWTFIRPSVRTFWSGTVLWIKVSCDGPSRFPAALGCGADLDLTVPPGAKVTATSTSGGVMAAGLSGALEMHTNSGSLNTLGNRGPIVFKGGSGEVHAEGLASPEVDAQVGSGTVDLAFTARPRLVRARTGSGPVTIAVPDATRYRLRAAVSSGDREVDPALNDPAAPGEIDVHTGSGSLSVRYTGRS
ncbi:DUF4097 family beta strand repeat-containing protein [Actinomadura macrotermitis]|uniref:DUF4097 domain-containing protein n=1 Tax=Actinomadura macrotermitis TaxID=2585200 RepID=A0A7K0C4D9_9ACTN|nr:DUF4097 family beta strand repeat-containing protein [Actinomadura macrotermitis]MQY08303.1 hypothetical protein [Actinomadura macrotermitis]